MEEPGTWISSWEVAEKNARDWMRYWGWIDARVTRGGADRGVDIQSQGALAQVKMEAAAVGRPALQRLVGARGRDVKKELLFFNGAGYSRSAIEYANEMGIALFNYGQTGEMEPINSAARAVVARAARGAGALVEPADARPDNERKTMVEVIGCGPPLFALALLLALAWGVLALLRAIMGETDAWPAAVIFIIGPLYLLYLMFGDDDR